MATSRTVLDDVVSFDALLGVQTDPVLATLQHAAMRRDAIADRDAGRPRRWRYARCPGVDHLSVVHRSWQRSSRMLNERALIRAPRVSYVCVYYGLAMVGVVVFRPLAASPSAHGLRAAQLITPDLCEAEDDANNIIEILLTVFKRPFCLRDLPGLMRGKTVIMRASPFPPSYGCEAWQRVHVAHCASARQIQLLQEARCKSANSFLPFHSEARVWLTRPWPALPLAH